jgi:hypothetical protein
MLPGAAAAGAPPEAYTIDCVMIFVIIQFYLAIAVKQGSGIMVLAGLILLMAGTFWYGMQSPCVRTKMNCVLGIVGLGFIAATSTFNNCNGVLGDKTPTAESIKNHFALYYAYQYAARNYCGINSELDKVKTIDGGAKPRYLLCHNAWALGHPQWDVCDPQALGNAVSTEFSCKKV